MVYLSDFYILRPPYESQQEHTLDWLVEAHVQAEKMTAGMSTDELERFRDHIREQIWRVGCKPDKIAKRGHIVSDYLHRDWDQMHLFSFAAQTKTPGLGERIQQYEAHTDKIFEEFYQVEEKPPNEIIHVTCTGYAAPSGAQKLIAKKNWGYFTIPTHAYHMGCYASIPAIRLAKGSLRADPQVKQVDIVHTEICSLHSNPSLHRLDQLISQSLFADGFIKYSAKNEESDRCLALLSTKEELIPDSSYAMSWNLADWGFEMSLAKEIPVLIARSLPGYLERLSQLHQWTMKDLCQQALFAIHPGGPKILSHVQEILSLSDAQIAHSVRLLSECGNMSSATLPHIWKSILDDPAVPVDTAVVSLAFGPGLTLCGALMVKRCG